MPNNIIAKKLSVNLDTIIQKVIRTDFTAIIGDSVEINVKVSERGNPKEITGCTVRLIGVRADKSYFEQTEKIEIADGENGVLKIYPRLDVLSVEGQCILGLVVEDEDEIINVQRFIINVGKSIAKDIIIDHSDDIETLAKLNRLLDDYRSDLDNINNNVIQLENFVSQKITETNENFNEMSDAIENQIDDIQDRINGVNDTIVYGLAQKIKLSVHRISGSNYLYFKSNVMNEPAKSLLKKQYIISIGGSVGNNTYNSSTSILSFYMENSKIYPFVVNISDRMVGSRNINCSVVYQNLSSEIGMNEVGYSLYVKSNILKDSNLDSEVYAYLTQLS